MPVVRAFLRQAEEILDIAAADDRGASDFAILIDGQGGMRMLNSTGWSLPALCAEYGAAAVYTLERRGRTVRVEGWSGGERCLIQRNLGVQRPSLTLQNFMPGVLAPAYLAIPQCSSLLAGERDSRGSGGMQLVLS
jgi:hypothetical protein